MYNVVNLLERSFFMAGKKVTMSMSERTLELLEKLSAEKGMKKSAIVALAVAEYAERQKGAVHGSK